MPVHIHSVISHNKKVPPYKIHDQGIITKEYSEGRVIISPVTPLAKHVKYNDYNYKNDSYETIRAKTKHRCVYCNELIQPAVMCYVFKYEVGTWEEVYFIHTDCVASWMIDLEKPDARTAEIKEGKPTCLKLENKPYQKRLEFRMARERA